jgi:hypothetical protein
MEDILLPQAKTLSVEAFEDAQDLVIQRQLGAIDFLS